LIKRRRNLLYTTANLLIDNKEGFGGGFYFRPEFSTACACASVENVALFSYFPGRKIFPGFNLILTKNRKSTFLPFFSTTFISLLRGAF
jgi:hypothetical protein